MKILVTGGAGYVGSFVTETLIEQGHQPIVLDNLQQGHRKAIPPGAEFVSGDIRDTQVLNEIFQRSRIDAVMHLAGETVVEFSMTDPKRYFNNNIVGGINLLDNMLKYRVCKFVFSSSASTYGEPERSPIDENHPTVPINSYGETKLMFEKVLRWYGKAYGISNISFRYFCAAGAGQLLGEDHHPETHLIPNVMRAALDTDKPVDVFGNDYPTPDGSCIRDFVHVKDIARAHILAINKMNKPICGVYNLGNEKGYSVFEVINAVKKVTGINIPVKISTRRVGDPAILIASAAKARAELGWEQQFTRLEPIIESAWKWMKEHPGGYDA
jgi:UDP-glucose 4-epimerase